MDILVLDGFGWALWSNQLTIFSCRITWQVTIAFCASITTARGWEIVQLSRVKHQIQLQQVADSCCGFFTGLNPFHAGESIPIGIIGDYWGILENIGEYWGIMKKPCRE